MLEINIGDEVGGVITEIIPPGHPKQKAKILCDLGISGWSCSVQFNSAVAGKTRLLRVGDEIDGWIIRKHSSRHFLAIGISNFGRFPPKPDTVAEYIDALSATKLALIKAQNGHFILPEPKALSCTKGLLSRCVKKDQWDWLIVYHAFKFEDDGVTYRTRDRFVKYQEACKQVAKGKADQDVLKLAVQNLLQIGFLSRIDIALHNLSTARIEWEAVKAPTPTRLSAQRPRSSLSDEPAAALPSPQPSPNEIQASLAKQASSRVRMERANAVHNLLVRTMTTTLAIRGTQSFYNGLIDLYCEVAGIMYIFEMKSTTQSNQLAQIRKAVSQLYEYRFLHEMRNAKLVIVLDCPPNEPWVLDYLLQDRDILVCWLSGDHFEYPKAIQADLEAVCGAMHREVTSTADRSNN